MAAHSDEHERTMAFAEIALGQIKALRQPAIPRNYEIWYTYATGYNPSLNRTVNETLAREGTLSTKDLEEIYDTYLSPHRLTDRIDTVGAKVVDEIEQVMAMIDAAVGSTSSYTESLVDVSQKLGSAADRDGLRAIVESLVCSTREVEQTNFSLEERLKASKQEIIQLQENLETVRNESLTDPLTGLANRKYFDQMLERAAVETKPNDEPLSLMLTDIDHFKKFNDTYGHLTGDQVLRLVAQAVKQNVKGQDIAARYGREEFAIILPNTGLRQALTVADHIRRGVVSKELIKRSTGENLGRVTISVGVAMLHQGEALQGLIERADACLYAAKRNGRNQVICETDPEVSSNPVSHVA
ncbi:MAG TPA: GGDEF domain-containing protein [Xanthobacteraceae bacterium]|nr:GGDEF domain-containing protein [Xanthobacteraceae bacterium]